MSPKNIKKFSLLLILVLIVSSYFFFDLRNFFSLEFIKNSQTQFNLYYVQNPVFTIFFFFIIYVIVTALSLPGAAVMTLAAGAFFGLVVGTIIVSFASSIGATLAAVVSRFLLRDSVEKRFKTTVTKINEGIKKEGAFYLFTLRLIPAFPFFVINLVMGLTKMKLKTFYLISQVGMLAGTIVYVNAGSQLSSLESLSGILSFNIITSFIILGLFPLIVKKVLEIYKNKRLI